MGSYNILYGDFMGFLQQFSKRFQKYMDFTNKNPWRYGHLSGSNGIHLVTVPPTIRGWWWSWDMPCRTASEMRFFVKKKSWPPINGGFSYINGNYKQLWKSTINKNPPFYINVWTLQNKSQIVPNQELKNTDPREKFWTIFPCLCHAYARRVFPYAEQIDKTLTQSPYAALRKWGFAYAQRAMTRPLLNM